MKNRDIKSTLVLGSGPDALDARNFQRDSFENIVAINNAWRVRGDWDYLIHPDDFPADRMPAHEPRAEQTIVTSADYVPLQNQFGGFIYAGGTMAFTAGYWALAALKPKILSFFGCDMTYSKPQTHFYGQGTADPLRVDISLQSLEAKSARLMILAALEGTLCVNLTNSDETRLVFPKVSTSDVANWTKGDFDQALQNLIASLDFDAVDAALATEKRLGYFVESGKYWEQQEKFDAAKLRDIDALWLDAAGLNQPIAYPSAHTNSALRTAAAS